MRLLRKRPVCRRCKAQGGVVGGCDELSRFAGGGHRGDGSQRAPLTDQTGRPCKRTRWGITMPSRAAARERLHDSSSSAARRRPEACAPARSPSRRCAVGCVMLRNRESVWRTAPFLAGELQGRPEAIARSWRAAANASPTLPHAPGRRRRPSGWRAAHGQPRRPRRGGVRRGRRIEWPVGGVWTTRPTTGFASRSNTESGKAGPGQIESGGDQAISGRASRARHGRRSASGFTLLTAGRHAKVTRWTASN